MNERIQIFRLISIGAALLVGFWLPIRVTDLELPVWLDILFDLMISLASIINLYLHFYESGVSPRKAKAWLKPGVIFDIICLIPLALLEFAFTGQKNGTLLLLNLLTVRHVRRIKPFLDHFGSFQPVVYRLLPLAFTMPLLVHLIACGWIALGSGTAGPDADRTKEYIKAAYWTTSTLTSVGYGDIAAKTNLQMLYASFVQIIGIGLFGYVLSNVASLLGRLDAAREHHMENLDRIDSFMRSNRIPTEVQAKTRAYYHYLWLNHKGYRDQALLKGLPPKIQSELFFHINRSIIEKVPFLKDASEELLEDLMHELEPRIYVPGEKIFRAGEASRALYFVHSGEVEILGKKGELVARLKEGAFFGEMALLSDRPRNATARSASFCDIYLLPKESFHRVLAAYPDFRAHVEAVAKQRQS